MKHSLSILVTLFILVLGTINTSAQTSAELLIKANRATLERDYSGAINYYNQFIALNPEDFRGYFNRGTTEYNAGKYKDAENDFSKTLNLNPIYKEAYYFRGQCFVKQKKYTLAINDYNHVLSKNPRSVPFLKLRSEAYAINGQMNLALKDLDTAVDLAKLSGDLYKRRAELKIKMKDINGAIRDYSSVEKLMPKYKMVHYIKGNLFLQIDEIEFACDEYKLALDNGVVVADRAYNTNCK
ncbi:MAG: hypothetical protein COA58_10325 [Bacteroidetes bacterium]|nr:MAG: hypothetical protein COA58_10325 [Bacteroidota bacterium]